MLSLLALLPDRRRGAVGRERRERQRGGGKIRGIWGGLSTKAGTRGSVVVRSLGVFWVMISINWGG
jgi:hypothetical protein